MTASEQEQEEHEPLAREGDHREPEFLEGAFHCPHCGVLTTQKWAELRYAGAQRTDYFWCRCSNCYEASCWVTTGTDAAGSPTVGRMVDPVTRGGPRPHVDMPDDVKEDYAEARTIVQLSPRGACALLRLCVQKLCEDLGEKGKNIDDDIASLVQQGLPVELQQALDSLRVIGNEAVHPGELDLKDDTDTATELFGLLNFIVQDRITRPKQIGQLYGKLPQSKRDAIAKRDK